SRAFLQWAADAAGPVVGAAVEHRYAVVAGPAQQGGGGHGPLAVSTHDGDRLVRHTIRIAGEVAEFEVDGVGYMPGGVLVVLADVEDRPGHAVRPKQRRGDEGAAGGSPAGDAAGQFPGDVGEVDGQGRPQDVGGVLVGVADDGDRDCG